MQSYTGYSNRNQDKLQKGTLPNINQLKLQILKRQGIRVVGDCIVPIKSVSFNEITTPIRNSKCGNPQCLLDLNEIQQYLSDRLKKEKDDLIYFCQNCISSNSSNKRSIKDLYFDRQAMTLITLAKGKFTDEISNDEKKIKRFKDGHLVFKKCGEDTPSCWYSLTMKEKNQSTGKIEDKNFLIPLQIGEKGSNTETLQFYVNDLINVQGLKSTYQKICKDESKVLKQVKSFVTSCSQVDIKKVEKDAVEYLGKVIYQNTVLKKFTNLDYFTKNYTFTFSNKFYLEPQNSSFTLLNIFFPKLKLWRSYRLNYQNNKTYSHPEGAVYIKQGYKIYVIGGYRASFYFQEIPKDQKEKAKYEQVKRNRKVEMTKEVIEIDLRPILASVLEPTRVIEIEGKLGLGKIRKTNVSKPIIDKLSPKIISVKVKAPLPDYLCNSAGVIADDNIFVFGGCTLAQNPNSTEWSQNVKGNSYCYNIKSDKWQTIEKLPNMRAYHSAIISKNLIYIIGGSQQKQNNYSRCNDESLKKIDIFDFRNRKYTTEEFKVNVMISMENCNDGFRSRALPLRYPLQSNEFVFITGDKHGCYSFDIDTKMFSFAGSQPEFNVLLKEEKSLEIENTKLGPKLQQVFDYSPPYVDGYYYFGAHNLVEKKSYVIYGIRGEWNASEEFDHGAQYKK